MFKLHLRKCERIARIAHSGQTRRVSGKPYVTHPESVASKLIGTEAKCVAWLHDVLEDTAWTRQMLSDEGVPNKVIESVVTLTKVKGVSYEDYLSKVKADPIARVVKITDMLDNLSDSPSERQIIKYAKGLIFLYS